VRLFNVADGRLLGEDRDYGGRSLSVAFRPDGRRLLTTSLDGQVRLYRWERDKPVERLVLQAKQPAPGGRQPFAARFSPDGRRIAVGFIDSAAVNVLDGDNLGLRFAPETEGVNGNMSKIAWSRDGAWLYAAGMANRDSQAYIRRWAADGDQTGRPVDWPVASDTIMDLTPLPDGRLVFGGAGPNWGVVNAAGQRQPFHTPAVADFRDNHEGFTLSNDATRVRFGYAQWGKSPTVFDSPTRAFLPAATSGLTAPLLTAPGLEVSDWKYTPAPKLNGQSLKLDQYEMSRSLALFPDAAGPDFVLGADWTLRAFDRAGREVWQQPVPGAVWAVNVSRDGRWVVAAYGDGTIRWHRATDGAEQLAFYPHPDQKRWVLWTPNGYYDASAGAEDLIGWHLNNGKEAAADFFPASRFRDRFHRPDVLARVLDTQNETEALRLADAERGRRTQQVSIAQVLPPVVEILSPEDGGKVSEAQVTLRYKVRTPGDAPVTAIRARVNGQAVETTRGLKPVALDDGSLSISIPLPRGDSLVQLFAENKNGVSTPAAVSLTWAGAKEDFSVKPKLYVLAVGVSNYADKSLKLNLPAKDARDFAAALAVQKGKLYREVEVKLLTDQEATKDEVVDGLDWLRKQVGQKDMGMLFLSGHGVNDPVGGYYYLPHNANPDKLMRTGVPMSDIRLTLASLAGKSVFFVDTCHAGNVLGSGRKGVENDLTAVVNELASAENGVVVFSSSTGREFSLEDPKWGNGAFTKALVEGLSGRADVNKSGRITHKMLDFYVSERVKELTRGQQHPVTQAPGGVPDFPLAALR
jgi:WD40 repeat protein